MNEFERRKRDAETVEVADEVVFDDVPPRANGDRSGGYGSSSGSAGRRAEPAPDSFAASARAGNSADLRDLRTLSHILYALYFFGWATAGVSSIVALVIDYVRRPAARGTIYASHAGWRIRTFWWSVLWYLLSSFFGLFAHVFIMMAACVTVWVLYRVGRGWLSLLIGLPMPLPAATQGARARQGI